MEPVGDLPWGLGGVSASEVVDNEVHLDLLLIHDFNGILDHLRAQYAAAQFVNEEGLGIRLLIARSTSPHFGKRILRKNSRDFSKMKEGISP